MSDKPQLVVSSPKQLLNKLTTMVLDVYAELHKPFLIGRCLFSVVMFDVWNWESRSAYQTRHDANNIVISLCRRAVGKGVCPCKLAETNVKKN